MKGAGEKMYPRSAGKGKVGGCRDGFLKGFCMVLPVYLWIPFETKFNECMDFALTIKHIYIAFSILWKTARFSVLKEPTHFSHTFDIGHR